MKKIPLMLISLASAILLFSSCHSSKQPVGETSDTPSKTETQVSDDTDSPFDDTGLSEQKITTVFSTDATTSATTAPTNVTSTAKATAKTTKTATTTKAVSNSPAPISVTCPVGETANLRGIEVSVTGARTSGAYLPLTNHLLCAIDDNCYIFVTCLFKNVSSSNKFLLHKHDIHFFDSTGKEIPLMYMSFEKNFDPEKDIDNNILKQYTFTVDKGKDLTCTYGYEVKKDCANSFRFEMKPETLYPVIDDVVFTK